MEAGLTCSACGHANRAGRKFCAECGTPLALACSSCGAANEPGERFCGECGSPLGAVPAPERTGVERRLVSVLFADLVGSTALSDQRDVEDVRELLSRYFELARTLIERHGGSVEKFIGDAVMAVWGAPSAREDDAERAVRAALELAPAVAALGEEIGTPALAARAAVLTGEAAVTLGAVGQGMVAGDIVNAASRVQALAEPGTVLVGDATRRATEAAIAYADAGVHELKGRAEPVQLWRALRVTAGRAAGGGIEPPFVGREREQRLLKTLFHASADDRKAHVVSIVGIAGIGKSRLASELRRYLDGIDQAGGWHVGRCLAYGEGVSFWALAEMVRMRAGIAEGEEPAAARAKLRAVLELHVEDPEERAWIEPRLAQLIALEQPDGREQRDLFAGWRLFFERLAAGSPLVLVLEDAQWADASLLEFVEHLLDWSRDHPIFVLALARPELEQRHPRWGPGRNSTTLALQPLVDDAMAELLDGFAPGLPDELRRQVLARAEGVPLYAVETVRMLLDRGLVERHGDGYRPTRAIGVLDVPETLHALVAARLDGLAEQERRVLRDASVLGKTFTREALAAVSPVAEGELETLLAGLARKEILSLQADPLSPERGQYAFLQDLVRQIALETMSRGERKARHLLAAAHVEQQWLDGEHELAEILASHYLAALELAPDADDAPALTAKARTTLVEAGERAASLAADENAHRYFEQALELAGDARERAELHERAGRMAVLGVRTEQARAHFEQAIAGFEELGLTRAAARVAAELGLLTWRYEGDVERAVDDLERAFAVLAGDERDADLAMLAAHLGRTLFFAGRHDAALGRTELALEIGEALRLPRVLSLGFTTKGLILSALGRHEEGEMLLRRAFELAEAHGVSDAAVGACGNLAAVVRGRDRLREALELTRTGAELARRLGDRQGEAWIREIAREVLIALGEWDDALALDTGVYGARVSAWLHAQPIPPFVHRGLHQEAAGRLAAAGAVIDLNEPLNLFDFRVKEAMVRLAEGEPRQALAAAEEALALRAEVFQAHGALGIALEAAFALGDAAKVDELLAIVEGLPPGELTPSLRAVGARFSARRAALAGDSGTADEGFVAAAELFREVERPFELAVVLLEHGEWLVSQGRAGEAAPLLAEAGEIFERLRAAPWLERLAAALPASAAVT